MKFTLKTPPKQESIEVVANLNELQSLYVMAMYDEFHPEDIPLQAIINEKGDWELRTFSYGTEDVYLYRAATEEEKEIKAVINTIETATNKINQFLYREASKVETE